MSDFDLVLTGRVVTTDRVTDGGWVGVRDELVERGGTGVPPSPPRRHLGSPVSGS